MINTASGGALMDKMPTTARHLISNMASNTQQFGIRGASQPRMVNEIDAVDNLRLENQLTDLTSLVRQLAVAQHQPSIVARVCGICTYVEHPTDMCPTLQETESDYTKIWKAIISARAESKGHMQLNDSNLPRMYLKDQQQPGVPTNHELQQYAVLEKYELCVHKKKKMRGVVEVGGLVSALTRNEDFIVGAQQALPKKCRDPRFFFVPGTIGDCTFIDVMLVLGASINVMPKTKRLRILDQLGTSKLGEDGEQKYKGRFLNVKQLRDLGIYKVGGSSFGPKVNKGLFDEPWGLTTHWSIGSFFGFFYPLVKKG
ncbi:hypothetical protein CR513_33419, partial [Mucuna pruriens]